MANGAVAAAARPIAGTAARPVQCGAPGARLGAQTASHGEDCTMTLGTVKAPTPAQLAELADELGFALSAEGSST